MLELLGSEGLTTREELAFSRSLRTSYHPDLVAAALELSQLRARARTKFSKAGSMYFTRDGLEQASAEVVSQHRAGRYADFERVADLCAGIGGDLIALAQGRSVLAVDLDPLHLRMATLNAEAYGWAEQVAPVLSDVRDMDLHPVQAVFVDPARRGRGKRELDPEQSSPPLSWCLRLAATVPAVAIKAAPGLPLDRVPTGWETEAVSVGGDLKEMTLWSPALATAPRRATLLPAGHSITEEPGGAVDARAPGRYLLDPDPAVTRSGLVETLARRLGAWKLDERIAFLSLDTAATTPFARTLLVEDSMPWSLKPLRQRLRELGIGAVDVRKRGSAVDVEDLHRRLRLREGRRATVVLTRVLGRPWALICSDLV